MIRRANDGRDSGPASSRSHWRPVQLKRRWATASQLKGRTGKPCVGSDILMHAAAETRMRMVTRPLGNITDATEKWQKTRRQGALFAKSTAGAESLFLPPLKEGLRVRKNPFCFVRIRGPRRSVFSFCGPYCGAVDGRMLRASIRLSRDGWTYAPAAPPSPAPLMRTGWISPSD